MTTKCNTEQLAFQGLGRREVVGRFDGGEISLRNSLNPAAHHT